jgi:hypothetical protein
MGGQFMKRNRAFAGLPAVVPHIALEISRRVLRSVLFVLACLLAQAASPYLSRAQVPVYKQNISSNVWLLRDF